MSAHKLSYVNLELNMLHKSFPKFSVLMAVYLKDNPDYLREAIDSLLNQTLLPNEIVVVRDGPITEELQKVLDEEKEKFPNLVITGYEENKGFGPACRFGVEHCKYDVIARMDSDDVSSPDRFEKQMKCLLEKKVDIVGSWSYIFDQDINNPFAVREPPVEHEDIVKFAKGRAPFIHPTIFAYKKTFTDCGNYNDWRLCEDFDLFVRMLEHGSKGYNIPEYLYNTREDKNFYKRRGGLKYAKGIVAFKKMLYKKHWLTRWQYFKTKWSTIIVALLPNFLRMFIYKKFLRLKPADKK